jgi:hypothetical protein
MANNPLLQNLFGSSAITPTPTFSQQAQQQYQQAQNQAPGLNLGQLAAQAHNQFGSAYNAYAQMSMHPQYATQQQRQFNAAAWPEQRWMIDGKYMTLREFVDFIWPEDCADKTFFVLKHTKETKND